MKLILMKKVKSYLMVAVGLVVNMVRVSSKIVLRPSNGVKYFKISGSNIKGLVWCQKKYNKKKSTVSFRSSEEIRCLWIFPRPVISLPVSSVPSSLLLWQLRSSRQGSYKKL